MYLNKSTWGCFFTIHQSFSCHPFKIRVTGEMQAKVQSKKRPLIICTIVHLNMTDTLTVTKAASQTEITADECDGGSAHSFVFFSQQLCTKFLFDAARFWDLGCRDFWQNHSTTEVTVIWFLVLKASHSLHLLSQQQCLSSNCLVSKEQKVFLNESRARWRQRIFTSITQNQ